MEQLTNPDVIRDTRDILSRGWYPEWQTLGEGGWPYLYHHNVDLWKTYALDLFDHNDFILIQAKDDTTAIRAFNSLYDLADVDHAIFEKITEYRRIE